MTDTSKILPKDTGDSQKYALDIVTAFSHRTISKLWVTITMLIVALVGSVCYMFHLHTYIANLQAQYQRVVIEQHNDSSPNNLINGDGDITYGNTDDDLLRP